MDLIDPPKGESAGGTRPASPSKTAKKVKSASLKGELKQTREIISLSQVGSVMPTSKRVTHSTLLAKNTDKKSATKGGEKNRKLKSTKVGGRQGVISVKSTVKAAPSPVQQQRKQEKKSCICRKVKDSELRSLLCLDLTSDELLDVFCKKDRFKIDPTMRIPFFASIRDYDGAVELEGGHKWILKPVKENEILSAATAAIVYFLDHFVKALSAPTILARIDNKIYRATKIISHSEQLSGANYNTDERLRDQLLLDIINRWIFADEDRNPNNYLVRPDFDNEGFPLIIPIDFANADLNGIALKIKGASNKFGWVRQEKTQYLSPLRTSAFMSHGMDFYSQRFSRFKEIDRSLIKKVCQKVFSQTPSIVNTETISNTISDNIISRVDYVHQYFKRHIPEKTNNANREKYSAMGDSFSKCYC